MPELTPYKNLQIVTPQPLAGQAGQALNDNFIEIADSLESKLPLSGGTVTGDIVLGTSGGQVYADGTILGTFLKASSGTITASSPGLEITQSWNSSSVSFTAIKATVDGPSASSSNFIDFIHGSNSRFSVSIDGVMKAYSITIDSSNPTLNFGPNGQQIYLDGDILYISNNSSSSTVKAVIVSADIFNTSALNLTPSASPPPSEFVVEGTIYYDSNDHVLKCYDGSTWQDLW